MVVVVIASMITRRGIAVRRRRRRRRGGVLDIVASRIEVVCNEGSRADGTHEHAISVLGMMQLVVRDAVLGLGRRDVVDPGLDAGTMEDVVASGRPGEIAS